MNARTQLLIGLAVVLLGLGVVALAFVDDEASVRRVEDLVQDPGRFGEGRHVLLGVPQPPLVPVRSSAGGTDLLPNPGWTNVTATTSRWASQPELFSTETLRVDVAADGATTWTWRNETRRGSPGAGEAVGEAAVLQWTTPPATRAFTVQAFDDGDGDTPRVWALYAGPLKDPMQPKPSQFEGRLLRTLPDGSGTPMPAGVLLYQVEEFTAGCSSKFLPPEEKARLEESGDL